MGWVSGSTSGRVAGADLFVIKPSGVSYDDLAPENMILCDLEGDVIAGTPGSERSPSSDTAAHAYVYRSTIGGTAKEAVKAAVMLEDVARTVHVARQGGPLIPLPQDEIDRLCDRYQNVYGQPGDERR